MPDELDGVQRHANFETQKLLQSLGRNVSWRVRCLC